METCIFFLDYMNILNGQMCSLVELKIVKVELGIQFNL